MLFGLDHFVTHISCGNIKFEGFQATNWQLVNLLKVFDCDCAEISWFLALHLGCLGEGGHFSLDIIINHCIWVFHWHKAWKFWIHGAHPNLVCVRTQPTHTKGLKCSRNLLGRVIYFSVYPHQCFVYLLMFRVKFKWGGGVVSLLTAHTVFSGYSLLTEVADFYHKPKAHSCDTDCNLSLVC